MQAVEPRKQLGWIESVNDRLKVGDGAIDVRRHKIYADGIHDTLHAIEDVLHLVETTRDVEVLDLGQNSLVGRVQLCTYVLRTDGEKLVLEGVKARIQFLKEA